MLTYQGNLLKDWLQEQLQGNPFLRDQPWSLAVHSPPCITGKHQQLSNNAISNVKQCLTRNSCIAGVESRSVTDDGLRSQLWVLELAKLSCCFSLSSYIGEYNNSKTCRDQERFSVFHYQLALIWFWMTSSRSPKFKLPRIGLGDQHQCSHHPRCYQHGISSLLVSPPVHTLTVSSSFIFRQIVTVTKALLLICFVSLSFSRKSL